MVYSGIPKTFKNQTGYGQKLHQVKKPDQIPFELIGELASRISVKNWIEIYENAKKR